MEIVGLILCFHVQIVGSIFCFCVEIVGFLLCVHVVIVRTEVHTKPPIDQSHLSILDSHDIGTSIMSKM